MRYYVRATVAIILAMALCVPMCLLIDRCGGDPLAKTVAATVGGGLIGILLAWIVSMNGSRNGEDC